MPWLESLLIKKKTKTEKGRKEKIRESRRGNRKWRIIEKKED